MDLSYDQQPSSRRAIGFAAVIVLHIFIFYALVSGLARNVVEIVKKPLETKIIVELPPPPQMITVVSRRLFSFGVTQMQSSIMEFTDSGASGEARPTPRTKASAALVCVPQLMTLHRLMRQKLPFKKRAEQATFAQQRHDIVDQTPQRVWQSGRTHVETDL